MTLALFGALLACGGAADTGAPAVGVGSDTAGDSGSDTAGDSGSDTAGDSGSDTAGDSGSDTAGDSGSDTGEPLQSGLLTWNGVARVDGGYVGTEQVLLLADNGLGDAACEIDYDVVSTGERTDCAECEWAWDVVLGPPTVVVGDACLAAGYDEATIAGIGGATRAYGLALDFMGHGNTLMVYASGRWTAVALAAWDPSTGALDYEWAQGYLDF